MNNPKIYQDAPEYSHYFFDLVPTDNLLEELKQSKDFTLAFLDSLPADKENFAYAPEKWTIKEVIRHIIDCERVYTYRALRFSRFDATELAGFDENAYMTPLKNLKYSLADLREEYTAVRNATLALYQNMTDEMLDFKGTANGVSFTARSLGFMAVGHNLHHVRFVQNNYLNKP